MTARPSSAAKPWLIAAHDLAATALAVWLTFVVRFDGAMLAERLVHLPLLLAPFLVYAALVYRFFRLGRTKWRFASLPELATIVRASGVLAATLLVVDYVVVSPTLFGIYFFGKIAIGLYFVLQVALLGGPRLAFRAMKDARRGRARARAGAWPVLLLARAAEAEVVLRAVEAGTLRRIAPRGILSPRADEAGQAIRGVPVLGGLDDLEAVAADLDARGPRLRRLVAAPGALAPEAAPERLLARARRLNLPIVRWTNLGSGPSEAELAPLEIEDLLLRETVPIDRARLARFLAGRRVLVTGGGGSIGSEIVLRALAFGAGALLVVEASEPALHAILSHPALAGRPVEGAIADVRDRARIQAVTAAFRPDVVVHAAALKQVPYLERDWGEGVKTNVFGTVHVVDAALAAGARAVVMISTDKAIEPVSVLGVTKRLAEIYVGARDAERRDGADGAEAGGATRLVAVRFGNVLGSVGSVVPVFKAQIARGGPVTVTDDAMVRYFMTVREAADLVLTAGSHADAEARAVPDPAAVYVLEMGQPVRIRELAERMIRLAGYEPGAEIEVATTGARPGERLNEILFAREEPRIELSGIEGVVAARPLTVPLATVREWLARLATAVEAGDRGAAETVFAEAVPGFGVSPAPIDPADRPAASPAPAPSIPPASRSALSIRGA